MNPNTKEYLTTGFTVTMWVRFLDKVSSGTLFHFGDPFRNEYEEPFGFTLETYVIQRDDIPTHTEFGSTEEDSWGDIFMDDGLARGYDYFEEGFEPEEGFFSESDTERFVRLVLREGKEVGDRILGSHVGAKWMERRPGLPEFGNSDYYTSDDFGDDMDLYTNPFDHEFGLMTNTRIPVNYGEWYFIVATYNPNINEFQSHSENLFPNNPNYWRGNINQDGTYTHYSGYGAKCKVEIISRTDLLRARGFEE